MAGDGVGIELALELGLELGLGLWPGLGIGVGLGLARTCCDASLFSEGAAARELLRPSTPLGGAATVDEWQKSPRALDSERSAASTFASASVALVTAAGVAGVESAIAATCRARARAAASAEANEPRPLPAPSANDLPSARAWYLRLVAAQERQALARGGKWLNRLPAIAPGLFRRISP